MHRAIAREQGMGAILELERTELLIYDLPDNFIRCHGRDRRLRKL